jgi:hypothetical protein
VLEDLRLDGAPSVSFGISADNELVPVSNLNGWKITWLSKACKRVLKTTGLTKRGDFRVCSSGRAAVARLRLILICSSPAQHKFGVDEEPLYVAYPPKGCVFRLASAWPALTHPSDEPTASAGTASRH